MPNSRGIPPSQVTLKDAVADDASDDDGFVVATAGPSLPRDSMKA